MADVFAFLAVAASEGAEELAFLVAGGDIKAIDFEFAGEVDFFFGEFADAFVPIADFFVTEDIGEALFRFAVGDFGEFAGKGGADALGWRIGGDQLRELLFEVDKFFFQGVANGFVDFGLVEGEVLVIEFVDFCA